VNPAQNFLMELKCAAIYALDPADIWKVLGEGRHPRIRTIFEQELQWHLSPPARDYWRARLHYFDAGLYRHGGTGRGLSLVRKGAQLLAGAERSILERFVDSRSIEEQHELWRTRVRPILVESGLLRTLANPAALWFSIGVPRHQWAQVIEGRSPEAYFDAVGEAVFSHSLVRTNHFWRWFFTGEFVPECCPRFLKPENLEKLKDGRLARLEVRHGTFLAAAREGRHDKLILGDHLDWYAPHAVERVIEELCQAIDEGAKLSFLTSSTAPRYAAHFRQRGFAVDKCAQMRPHMDRCNTYEGYYIVSRPSGRARSATPPPVHGLPVAEPAVVPVTG
jgi:S-adenosylmethionine:diacylglycerol 3-amino-3-carboxypropyl transferase